MIAPLLLALTAMLSACATKPSGGSGTTTASEQAPVRAAPPVVIPATSAKRLVLTMTGTETVVKSKDWAEFKREWRETFAEHAKQSGVSFDFVDTAPSPGTEEGTLLSVDVADYRIVGIGARVMFGIMTGNAFIDAKAKFSSLRTGTLYGEQQYNTSSSAAHGIFAKVTPQQVDAIAATVFMDLKAAK
ncbi:hypothetical protein [Piscinibacter defluvii]|uniref:hypothetical protein n=1 Tax=Piscinibacter defluvii TaxID=1796922 RepID=UPI000FDF09B6|nr:hypothetical protein [Piscinibacter defluvii]